MRSTGFSRPQLATLRTRDGDRCVWTGNHSDRLIPQHRVNRGMGGNRDLNVLVNGVLMQAVYGDEWFEWWAVATETAHSRALANLGGW